MLNKLCRILFFISLSLVALQSYAAAPPPLPMPSQNSDIKSKDEQPTSDSRSSMSIFDKIKQFFHKSPKKAPLPNPQAQQDKPSDKLVSQESNKNEVQLPNASNETHQTDTNLVSHNDTNSEKEASEPFIDMGSATLSSASNQTHQANANLASHNDTNNEKEASEPFIDMGSATLPSASNQTHQTNMNLASHSDTNSEKEASEPFIDMGNATLPSASNQTHQTNTNLASHDDTKDVASSNNKEANSTPLPNTANNEETQPELKVAGSLISNPPLRPGSYVVPPAPRTQVYQPIALPPTHQYIKLTPPPEANEQQDNVTAPPPPQVVAPTVMPATPVPVVNQPTASDVVTPPVTTPAPVPATPSTPNTPVPTVNQPTAPTAPSNTPIPAVQPVVPPATMPTTTDSSAKTDNSKETFTADVNSPKKQDWNTPLKPVEVLSANQNQGSNNTNAANNSAPANQKQVQPQNTSTPVSSSNVVVKKQDNIVNTELTESATKFAKDESQMLLLPDDDIILGKLTEQATLDQMDIYSYIKLFQKKAEWIANADRRKAVESLVKYDNDLNKKKDITATLSYCSAIDNSFRAIDRNNLSKLRVLLDVYPILQEKNNKGDTLLTAAVYKDNYYLAKYLVIRGIKISTLNSECQYPLDIAIARGNTNIACMLTKAKGY
ncbi:ankyrin repeat domain-containing protein [Rickettsia endosymbiont of Seladonia tumulorum]|uniref:ankyrin repeat domain-containing protein n=1 Tax=Rickettsia endosymbiont of Seladonia tumulorum TaxID=3066270 RepID=UPI00313EEE22